MDAAAYRAWSGYRLLSMPPLLVWKPALGQRW